MTRTAALITVTISLIYYSVAIIAFGGCNAFFSHRPLIVLTIAGFALLVVALFSPGNLSSGQYEDRSNRWVLAVFSVLTIFNAYLPPYTDKHQIWTLDGETTRWFGIGLFIIGCILRIWPVFILGSRFSGLVAIQSGHLIVKTGLYKIIRHPSYLGLIITSLGWSLAFRSGLGILLTAFYLWPLIARMNAEEKLLLSHFGHEYSEYCTHTWRLIPWLY